MKAAFVKSGGGLEVLECPTPKPGAGEILLKVAYCGICGSDVHMLQAGLLPPGCIIGHELSGYITAVGDGVEGWHEGEAVAAIPYFPCMVCDACKSGHTQLCVGGLDRSYGLGKNAGGFSQYMVVKPSALFKIPSGMDMKTAAINEPWGVAVHAVNMLELKLGAMGAVLGAGPIGLLTIYALKKTGAYLYVSEPDKYRAGKAKAAGADVIIDPNAEEPFFAIMKSAGRTMDWAIDCAGTATSIQAAAGLVGPRGLVVVVGVHMGVARLAPIVCFYREARLYFSFSSNYREFGVALELLAGGAVNPEVVISDVMPLRDIDKAFKLISESGHSKILIDCQAV